MIIGQRGKYARKAFINGLYTWNPESNNPKGRINAANGNGKDYCTATPGSQGEDWVCTYVYNVVVEKGVQKRIAYVACDYVQ